MASCWLSADSASSAGVGDNPAPDSCTFLLLSNQRCDTLILESNRSFDG
jgi:hypothetical protein